MKYYEWDGTELKKIKKIHVTDEKARAGLYVPCHPDDMECIHLWKWVSSETLTSEPEIHDKIKSEVPHLHNH